MTLYVVISASSKLVANMLQLSRLQKRVQMNGAILKAEELARQTAFTEAQEVVGNEEKMLAAAKTRLNEAKEARDAAQTELDKAKKQFADYERQRQSLEDSLGALTEL